MPGFVPKPLRGTRCAKCNGFILERVDGIPFCSECQKKIEGEIKSRVPKLRGKVLVSERVG
jgi:ribosomal protein L37AE/L43A